MKVDNKTERTVIKLKIGYTPENDIVLIDIILSDGTNFDTADLFNKHILRATHIAYIQSKTLGTQYAIDVLFPYYVKAIQLQYGIKPSDDIMKLIIKTNLYFVQIIYDLYPKSTEFWLRVYYQTNTNWIIKFIDRCKLLWMTEEELETALSFATADDVRNKLRNPIILFCIGLSSIFFRSTRKKLEIYNRILAEEASDNTTTDGPGVVHDIITIDASEYKEPHNLTTADLNNIDLSALIGSKTKLIAATPEEKRRMNKCIVELRYDVEDSIKEQLSSIPANLTLYHTIWEEVPLSYCAVMYYVMQQGATNEN